MKQSGACALSWIKSVRACTLWIFSLMCVLSYSCYPAGLCTWWSLWGALSAQADPRTLPALAQHSHCCTSLLLCSGLPCSKALPPCAGSLAAMRNIHRHSVCKYHFLSLICIAHPTHTYSTLCTQSMRVPTFHHVTANVKVFVSLLGEGWNPLLWSQAVNSQELRAEHKSSPDNSCYLRAAVEQWGRHIAA